MFGRQIKLQIKLLFFIHKALLVSLIVFYDILAGNSILIEPRLYDNWASLADNVLARKQFRIWWGFLCVCVCYCRVHPQLFIILWNWHFYYFQVMFKLTGYVTAIIFILWFVTDHHSHQSHHHHMPCKMSQESMDLLGYRSLVLWINSADDIPPRCRLKSPSIISLAHAHIQLHSRQ